MQNLLDKDLQFCSQGDTSSKHIPKKIFRGAKGSFLYDTQNVKYLDMQMFNIDTYTIPFPNCSLCAYDIYSLQKYIANSG